MRACRRRYAAAPVDGVGVWMDDAGKLAAFGFRQLLVLVQGRGVSRIAVPYLTAGCVSGDGSLVVIGLDNGEVRPWTARAN